MFKITKIKNGYKIFGGGVIDLEGHCLVDSENALGVYPIGSVYISVNNTSPAQLFGGTWEKLKDRFLLGAGGSYSLGSEGGQTSQSHAHWQNIGFGNNLLYAGEQHRSNAEIRTEKGAYVKMTATASGPIQLDATDSATISTMPPYLAVNIWKRI